MAYTFDPLFAADPNNPAMVAKNAAVLIFNPAIPGVAVTITDATGSPLPNPITVNAAGFGPAFQHATLDRLGWSGGGFENFITSYEGMKQVATDAKTAAQTAAATAGADAVADVATRIAAGEFKGANGKDGSNGLNGANVLPTSEAIAQAVTTDGPAKAALSAGYAPHGLAPTSAKPRKPLVANMVATFANGHGWFNYNGAASFTANDTSDSALGTQSVRIVTDAINTAAIMRSPAVAVDATNKQFVIWVKVTGVANLTEMNLYAGDSTLANHYNWTIADNGGVAQHVFREGEWSPVVLGFSDAFVIGSPNRAALTLMQFRTRASNGNTVTVRVGGIGMTPELSTFPKGVISITCDDSYLSQFTQLKTALDKYGWGATAYTIVDRLGVAGFMTLDHLKELERVHGWEIGGHSYTMANHGIGYGNMTDAEVEDDIKKLKTWLVDNNFIGADHMAYPLGSYSVASQAVIGKYFATGRTVTNRLIETIRPSDRMRLRSLSVSNTIPLSTAKALVDKVAAQKGWGIITFHDLVTTPTVGTHWSIADTFALIDYIATKDVVVMNVGDVTSRLAAPAATAAAAAPAEGISGALLHAALGNAPGKLNALPRAEAAAGVATVAGRADFIAFTPTVNMTITKLAAMTSGTVWAGHTLARMGLYTVDSSGTVALVAQTAADATLFTAAQTAYQRALDTAGGYPASYGLVAGQRYAVGIIGVGQTAGQLRGGSASSVLAMRAPIMGGTIGSGLTDLPATGTITATGNYPWAELAA